MSNAMWAEVAELADEHTYMNGVERTVERVAATAEVFTPTELVVEMLASLPIDSFAPGKKIIDPACGDGQFLVAVKWVKVLHFGMNAEGALQDIYGIDIMRDNVDLCLRRLGGGTIVMGDALHPDRRLEGQTEAESDLMRSLFAGDHVQETLFS